MVLAMQSFESDSADGRVKSFRLYPPIRWKDLPLSLLLLVLAVSLITGINFAASKLLSFLDRDVQLVLIGLGIGFQLSVWWHRSKDRSASRGPSVSGSMDARVGQVSDRVRALAADPDRKIEAIKALREETGTGMSLAEAKDIIEAVTQSQRRT
jgi:hypothetical protein